jgi:micrococcal nuclease
VILAACGAAPREPLVLGARTGAVPVLRVVDGDTLHVRRDDEDVTIRLIGVDAPEVDWYGGQAECFGARAGRSAMRILDGRRVRLEFDEQRLDPYDRPWPTCISRTGGW